MKWLIGDNPPREMTGQEVLEAWYEGEIDAATRARSVDKESWQPLGDLFQEILAMEFEANPELELCAYSRTLHPRESLMPYGDQWVLPKHKEAFVQQLMEGKEPSVPAKGHSQIYSRPSEVLAAAFKLYFSYFWVIAPLSFFVMLITDIVNHFVLQWYTDYYSIGSNEDFPLSLASPTMQQVLYQEVISGVLMLTGQALIAAILFGVFSTGKKELGNSFPTIVKKGLFATPRILISQLICWGILFVALFGFTWLGIYFVDLSHYWFVVPAAIL